MENNEEIKKEDKRAIKKVLVKLIDEEPKELSQEEAIKNYTETNTKKTSASGSESESDESNQEEAEHLKRVKAELLSSLKRVEDLSKKIFVNKEFKNKNIVKDRNGIGGVSKNRQIDENNKTTNEFKNDDKNKTTRANDLSDEKTIE